MKNLNMVRSSLRYLSFSLLVLMAFACSDIADHGIYVLMTKPPDFMGRLDGQYYFYPVEDLNLSINIKELDKIYDDYDKKAKKGQSKVDLLKTIGKRNTKLIETVAKSMSMDTLLHNKIPIRIIRLNMSQLDQMVFVEKEQFYEFYKVTKEALKNGKNNPL